MSSDDRLTYNDVLTSLTELLEVAIHTLLYIRQVYPPDLFSRKSKWRTAVYHARHPALADYIAGVVREVREQVKAETVENVVLVIKDSSDTVLERYVFKMQYLQSELTFNMRDKPFENAMTRRELESYLRGVLMKLLVLEAGMEPLDPDDDSSFAILIELRNEGEPYDTSPTHFHSHSKSSHSSSSRPSPWIPAPLAHTTHASPEDSMLVPVRGVNTGIINKPHGRKVAELTSWNKTRPADQVQVMAQECAGKWKTAKADGEVEVDGRREKGKGRAM